MNDDYRHHRNSAVCYQLAQSVMKIGSVLERVGQGEVVGALLWVTVHGSCCSWLQKRPGQHWMACPSAFLYKRV